MDLFFDNEFRTLIPPLQPEELAGLEASLIAEGNRDPVIIWKETRLLLDGHNRYDLCHKHNIELKPPIEMSFADRDAAMIWIIRNQFGRRNLNTYQRSALALRLETLLIPVALAKQLSGRFICPDCGESFGTKVWECPKCHHHWPMERTECWNCHEYERDLAKTFTQGRAPTVHDQIADIAKVSRPTLDKVKFIEERATPEQKAKLVAGTATINQVAIALKREEIKQEIKQAEWPTGKYRVIYADPPWQYSNSMPVDGLTSGHFSEQADHYQLMSVDQICVLPVRELAIDDSVLFLWATSPILEESFRVINAWGFKYKACFVWDKVKHNMGHYNSVRHEFLLVAVRGSCQPDETKLYDSVQTIERNGHSEKPEEFRAIINTLYPYGPRIELFARKKTEGWEVYGNDIS